MRHFSPEDIESYQFLYSMPGYNRAEVRAFLKALSAQVRDLQQRLNEADSTHQSEVADVAAAAEDATRHVLTAAEARMKTAAADLRAELDAFRWQIAELIAELTARVEQVGVASGSTPAAVPPPAVAETRTTHEAGTSEVEDVMPPRETAEAQVEPRVVPTGPIATSPSGEEQEIPPEWAELMREPEPEE